MRELIKHFVNICAKSLPIIEPIYEFGSHQVPGQEGFADLHPIFPDMEYVGSDMREGVGVDRVLNLHHIDLPDESVGTVLCLDTLEHVEYPRRAMEEIRRILKPDGLVVISSVMNFPIHDYPNDYWRFTPEAFNILLQDFNRHYSDFAGDEQFPHTVIGVAFKGDIPEEILEIFQQEIKVWKELCRGEDEGPENQVSGADKDLPSPPSPSPSSSPSPSPAQHFEPPSSKRYEPASLINLGDKNDSHSLIVELAGTNNTILEVGTSTGYLTRILKVRGNRVIGIEVDGEAAKIAEEHCDLMITGNVEEIDLDDYLAPGSIDVAVFGDVLEHLKYPAAVLKKVRRYLKPHGSVVVSIPNVCHGDVLINLLNGEFRYTSMGLLDETHLRFFGLKNVLDLLADSGYSVEEVRTTRHPVGGTELRRSPEEVPEEIRRFIEALPNSDVYQFVLLARPSNNPKSPPVPTADLKAIFDRSVEPFLREHEEPLRREVAEALAKSQEASERLEALKEELESARERGQCLELAVSEREGRIAELSLELAEAGERARSLDQAVSEREGRIAEISDKLRESENNAKILANEIIDMRQSVVWRLLMKYQNGIVDKALPQGTHRRQRYDLGLRGFRILANEGLTSFWGKYKNYNEEINIKYNEYDLWIRKNEPTVSELNKMRIKSKAFKYRPKISIITPVWNTDEICLRRAVESVLNQVYNNWELCIAEGGSTKSNLKNLLKEYSHKDDRIKIKYLDKNEGIAGNSNQALSLANGEFVAFLDHDDEIAPFALYEVVKIINQNSEIDFIYSDEDKLDEAGNRCDVFFKPDWSPDLILSCMYTCHLGVYRKQVVDKIGGFRLGFEGSQDYDFLLRFIENIDQRNIVHIPKVLYHWRKIPGSIASDPNAKYLINIQAAKKALNDALIRRGIKGIVCDGKWLSSYRIKRDIIGNPKVSIIIPTKDHGSILRNCIESINSKTTYSNYELIVADNNSTESDAVDYLNMLDNIVIRYPEQFNFSKINNISSKYANGEFLLFLNNDIEVITPDWIEAILEHAQRPEVGAVGCKLLYPDNTIQHAGVILGLSPDPSNKVAGHVFIKKKNGSPGYFGLADTIRNYSAVTAAAMMIRKDVFEEVGGFDENLAVSYNDVDLCLKIRAKGYLITYTPYAELLHHESMSRGHSLNKYEVDYMLKKWGNVLNNDPYYNPNLSLRRTNCEVNN